MNNIIIKKKGAFTSSWISLFFSKYSSSAQILKWFKFFVLSTLCWLVVGQASARNGDPGIPSIERPVHVSDQGDYERPYVSVFRTTRDGRLSHNMTGTPLRLYLNNPEKVDQIFHDGPTGPDMLSRTGGFNVSKEGLRPNTFSSNSHTAICEVPNDDGSQRNPYACGDDDCYDVVFISAGAPTPARNTRIFIGTPGTVRVSNPKTPQARIVDVEMGTPVRSPHEFTFGQMFEPMTTEDGNLMMGRVAGSRLRWNNRRTGRNVTGTYDMVYMAAPDNPARACDVTQWDEMKPLGHAPYDPEINTRYGFAKQLFRDATGNVVPDNTRMGGTYPWIDSKGNNVMWATGATRANGDFPLSCVPNRGCNDNNFPANPVGLQVKVIAGLWTNGKMVVLDNMVNNIDYSQPQLEDNGHRMADMYRAGTRANGSGSGLVRLGAGRDNTGGAGLPANATNTTFQESIENKLNFWKNMRPARPGDVVWNISTGAASDELRFDEFQFTNSYIISSMTQATQNNGQRVSTFNGVGNNRARVQNAVGSERWNTPPFGEVVNARIERVALGGVFGKGLWLNGNARIDYNTPSQQLNRRQHDWHISLFVDARFSNDNTVRNLISFPDGTELQIQGRNRIRFWDGSPFNTVNLSTPIAQNGWTHIGVQMTEGNTQATLYINGFAVETFTHDDRFFEFNSGTLSVGDHSSRNVAGFTGWIDDFKVIAHETNAANWCGNANGILVGSDNFDNQWESIALNYPDSSHQAIDDTLRENGKTTYSRYACYVDYSDDYAAHRDSLPRDAVDISADINFPEGPLVHDQPRPDSSNNQFCLSCHTAQGQGGFGLDALTSNNNLTHAQDPRRQPMEPVARVFGHIPANWLAEGVPENSLVAPSQGYSIDEMLQLADAGRSFTPSGNDDNSGPTTVNGTSASNNSGDARLAVDGNQNTRWTTRTAQRPGQWFQLDLGSVQTVGSVTLDSSRSSNDEPAGFILATSTDGNNFSTAATGSGSLDGITEISFSNRSVRYIRITQTGSKNRNWWSIHEMSVSESSNSNDTLYSIVHESSNLRLRSFNDDAELVPSNFTGALTKWRIIDAGNSYVFIENPETNQRLRMNNNGDVHMAPAGWNGGNVQWRLANNPDGTAFVVNNAVGDQLHASEAQNNVLESVPTIWTGPNVRWNLIPD